MTEHSDALAPKSIAAWQFFQQMVADVTKVVTEDAESERELLEGLRVIARVSSLCAQLSVEADLSIARGLDYYTGVIFETFGPVIEHRLVLSPEAIVSGVELPEVLVEILRSVAVPTGRSATG